jgi:hypothetical protein
MNTEHTVWRRLTPDTIAELPESGAVFEIANLVRTVHYIGTARGNLRQRVATWSQEDAKHSPMPGGYFVRYEPAAAEDKALEDRLQSYRAAHGGRLPTGNREQPATVSKLASRNAA